MNTGSNSEFGCLRHPGHQKIDAIIPVGGNFDDHLFVKIQFGCLKIDIKKLVFKVQISGLGFGLFRKSLNFFVCLGYFVAICQRF